METPNQRCTFPHDYPIDCQICYAPFMELLPVHLASGSTRQSRIHEHHAVCLIPYRRKRNIRLPIVTANIIMFSSDRTPSNHRIEFMVVVR